MNTPYELKIDVDKTGADVVVRPAGEVDVYTSPNLKEALIEAISEGPERIIVDLQAVSFIDSMGLGVLLSGLKRARATGAGFELICGDEKIRKIFRITGLDKVFVIHDPA